MRKIDRFVDLSDLRAHLGPYYSDVGRPSIDPELMIRMLIVGYCFGIRSERRLCEEVHLNLAYRWFCRLGLDADVPDHSTFSKNRHGRFRESDLLRKLFETVVARCMKEGIVGGEAFAVDASIIVADAHRRRGVGKVEDLDPTSSRAVAEYLSVLDDAAFGGATPVEPKAISPTDPAARYTAAADKRKSLHAAPHVRVASRDPDPASRGDGDHDRSAFRVAEIRAEDAPAQIRTRASFTSTTIRPGSEQRAALREGAATAPSISTGAKPETSAAFSASRRQR